MLSVKLLDDYLIKDQDIKTFKIQLLRDSQPNPIPSDCTVELFIANSKNVQYTQTMEIVDREKAIVQFTLHATIGVGTFDCEFVMSNGNDVHLSFPDSGYTKLKITECLAERPNALPLLSFNEIGELVVTINGVSKVFVPKT